jgi:hypothetical protein
MSRKVIDLIGSQRPIQCDWECPITIDSSTSNSNIKMKRKNPLIAHLGSCCSSGLIRFPIADLKSRLSMCRTWFLSLLMVMFLGGTNMEAQTEGQTPLGEDPPIEVITSAMEVAILISDTIESGVRKIKLYMNPCMSGSTCRFRLHFVHSFPVGVQIRTRTSAGLSDWITTEADSRLKHGQIDFDLGGGSEEVQELITIVIDPLFTGYDNRNELVLFDGGPEVLVVLLDQHFFYNREVVGKHLPSPTPPVAQPCEQLSLSPNPTSGHCDVRFSGDREAGVVVRNQLGQVVLDREITPGGTVRLDLQGLPPGVYIVHEKNHLGKAVRLVIQ